MGVLYVLMGLSLDQDGISSRAYYFLSVMYAATWFDSTAEVT